MKINAIVRMEEFFKETVVNLSKQSTCQMKQVGALIVKENRIISTGYNGCLPGAAHCNSHDHSIEDHHEWGLRNELHAEQNAILIAAKNGISLNGCTCYSSLQPCNTCMLMLLQVGIKEIVYLNQYNRSNYSETISEYISSNNIIVRKFNL